MYMVNNNLMTHILYNVLVPVERVLTLVIYALNEFTREKKVLHYGGIVLVVLVFGLGFFLKGIELFFQPSNVITALALAILSYLHLRSITRDQGGPSRLIFYFALANLIYFTFSTSALSAVPLAYKIDPDFAIQIFYINLVGYSLWSLILIFALLWKPPKT
jgi:hypothetical protein